MNKFVKTLLALGITSAFGLSVANAATYQVIDKGDISSLKYTYAQEENNAGDMVMSGANVYNFPVQFQYLEQTDYDAIELLAARSAESVHELSALQDKALLEAGTPTANDLAWVVRYLQSKSTNVYQKVGNNSAIINIGGISQELAIFDTTFEGTNSLTRSTNDYVNGITDDGWVYGNGSAPYLPLEYTQDDGGEVTYWLREFTSRGYFSVDYGQTIIEVIPPENRFGGESAILDISDSHYAVGYASVAIDESKLTTIEDESGGCADPENLANVPFEVCVQGLASNLYDLRAFKWSLDSSGVVSEENLGLLVTPNEEDVRAFTSVAQAVNSHGVAVGFAHGWWDETETEPVKNEARKTYAVVYKDGRVVDFTEDHSKEFDSRAYDINDAGIAVGHVNKYVNGTRRTKFYYVDTTDLDNMTMVQPEDFFTGSSSTAKSINENGIIVGYGEVETHQYDPDRSSNNPRRTHAFMYDINSNAFTDLNDLLSCNSVYTVIEAAAINENNEISATAIVKVPRRDPKGELMLGDDGQQLTEDVVRAIKLAPLAGEIEDCSQVEEKVERQGAGFGMFTALALFLMALTRRKHHNVICHK
ncbi:DUF3466 family protein [Colwelliaceae bacterium 6471]